MEDTSEGIIQKFTTISAFALGIEQIGTVEIAAPSKIGIQIDMQSRERLGWTILKFFIEHLNKKEMNWRAQHWQKSSTIFRSSSFFSFSSSLSGWHWKRKLLSYYISCAFSFFFFSFNSICLLNVIFTNNR